MNYAETQQEGGIPRQLVCAKRLGNILMREGAIWYAEPGVEAEVGLINVSEATRKAIYALDMRANPNGTLGDVEMTTFLDDSLNVQAVRIVVPPGKDRTIHPVNPEDAKTSGQTDEIINLIEKMIEAYDQGQ